MTATATLLSWHGDPELKARTVAEMQAHREADRLVRGQYWDNGKGCAVGCLTHDPDGGHSQYPERWGIPEALAHLEDRIFEWLPNKDAQDWPVAFLEAIPVGADLSLVADRLKLWLLRDSGLLDRSHTEVASAIDGVVALLARRLAGDEPSVDEWSSAARSAWSSAESAAQSAAQSASSAVSSAAAAALSAARRQIADQLLGLLRAAGASQQEQQRAAVTHQKRSRAMPEQQIAVEDFLTYQGAPWIRVTLRMTRSAECSGCGSALVKGNRVWRPLREACGVKRYERLCNACGNKLKN
jgi:hypothetical protein